jgi:hypothetical protein
MSDDAQELGNLKKKFSVSTLTMSHRQMHEADDYESIGAG